MDKTVIVLNGPPFSGKDTAADMIEEKYSATHLRFKTKLYQITALINNFNLQEFIKVATDVDLKDSKILKRGKTARKLLIETSEDVIKPTYGSDYFGNDVGDSVRNTNNKLFVISDSGFVDELYAMMRGGNLTGKQVIIIRLYRKGCNFDNDSRDYISDAVINDLGITCYDIENKYVTGDDASGIEFATTIQNIVNKAIK